jgi:hypothetical protein
MKFASETIEVTCTVEIEQSAESFHAHAIPNGIDIRPGDTVVVHGAPTEIKFGDHVSLQCSATVVRANPLRRLWTRLTAVFELTELYEVGFQRGK